MRLRLAAAGLLAALCTATTAFAQTAEPRRVELPRGDGTTIDVTIWDRGEGAPLALVVLGGSDCLLNEDRGWFGRVLDGASARYVVSVEKEGALPAPDGSGRCGETYERNSVESRRALDHVRALTWLRRDLDLPRERGFQLLATSAGGMAACAVAGATDDVQSVALLSTGGGRSFAEDMRGLAESYFTTPEAVDRVLAEPRMGRTWLGDTNPEIWWWSALPLECAGQMEGYAGPVLLIHGTADTSSPVETARLLAERLEAQPGVTIDYRELDGGAHDLFIGSEEKPVGGDGLTLALEWFAVRAAD